jgi:hypothetical protein
MKRLLAIFLLIIVVFAAASILAALAPISADILTHHLSVEVASIAIAGPSFTLNEWLKHRRISRAQWYRMPPDEKPATYGEGRMQRISSDADARWLKAQERKSKQSKTAA